MRAWMTALALFLPLAACDKDEGDGSHEFCDGVDNDNDGNIDETFDIDADGFLADEADCRMLGEPTDCNDLDPGVHPDAAEACDGLDNDCSGRIDDAEDADGDLVFACADCDDADPYAFPGAVDVCDGKDNDCSGAADEAWDEDGDGSSPCGGDCNDRDPNNAPGFPEVCDGRDNDCDGIADGDFDQDADGWRTCDGDCDDARADVNPGRHELCDGVDNDCDGVLAENDDSDGDSFSICEGDCDDFENRIYPDAPEQCDSLDNDCNDQEDEIPECFGCFPEDNYWFCQGNSPYYWYSGTDWHSARDACAGAGGYLAILDTREESEDVRAMMEPYLGYGYGQDAMWIGLSDEDTEGLYQWLGADEATFFDWANYEPSDYNGYEDCINTTRDGWREDYCGSRRYYICEFDL